MTHYDWIKSNFIVLAEDEASHSILFVAYGETVCEVNGQTCICESVEDFYDLVEFFRGETFEI